MTIDDKSIILENKQNIEIVSPAGNFEKLKLAVNYGADAVYFGGDKFNLRVQSGNFSYNEIRTQNFSYVTYSHVTYLDGLNYVSGGSK